jgi:hypothetical protein
VSASMFDAGDCAGDVVGLCLGPGLLDFGGVGLVKFWCRDTWSANLMDPPMYMVTVQPQRALG